MAAFTVADGGERGEHIVEAHKLQESGQAIEIQARTMMASINFESSDQNSVLKDDGVTLESHILVGEILQCTDRVKGIFVWALRAHNIRTETLTFSSIPLDV